MFFGLGFYSHKSVSISSCYRDGSISQDLDRFYFSVYLYSKKKKNTNRVQNRPESSAVARMEIQMDVDAASELCEGAFLCDVISASFFALEMAAKGVSLGALLTDIYEYVYEVIENNKKVFFGG
ncbi:hypothetical protein QVD17_30776 [Tagetes erecta]|uniref:Uncharacterized protein n=1 Tax=Tagetes erecta TaxID=13708 RepID=A0AAD8NNA0_TARER|nr:hypothetical protein QVD17_30776 [Tagetes erecta]